MREENTLENAEMETQEFQGGEASGNENDEKEEISQGEPEFCFETLEDLINKNTESFTCLAQLLLSRSSLLRHPLYHFPPLEDPGIDAAFNYVESPEAADTISTDKYKSMCKELNIVPSSRVIKSLPTSSLNLRYYGLTSKQLKAITKSLIPNIYVKELNLEENYMEPDSTIDLGEMMRENNVLQKLNLKECRIGPEGAKHITEGIMATTTLTDLDLSCNSLGTEGLKNIQNALKDNCSIKTLNLSKNDLDEFSVPALSNILNDNFALENLDLSWNRINTPAAWKQLVTEGLLPNKYLRSLNLSWNGINSKLVLRFLLKYTKETETLEYLDLSNNRISGELVRMIKAMILKNHSLLGLNIGFNPLSPEDAQMLIDVLLLPKNQRPKLEVLNMDNVYVKKNFLTSLRRATRLGKSVKIGGVLGNWVIRGPDIPKLLFERCRLLAKKPKKKKMQRDFSHFIFSLPDKPMRRDDFLGAVKKFKMKAVDRDLMDQVADIFKFKKKGVDCVAMRESYCAYYPDAEPAPKKQKKKGKGKKKKRKQSKDVLGNETGTEVTTEGVSLPSTLQGGITTEETSTIQPSEKTGISEGETTADETEVDEEEEGDEEEDGEGQLFEGNQQPMEVAYAEEVPQVVEALQAGDEASKANAPSNEDGNRLELSEPLPTLSDVPKSFEQLTPISEVSEID